MDLRDVTKDLMDAVIEALRMDGIDAEAPCDAGAEGELCCSLCRAEGCVAHKVVRAKAALR